MTQGRHQQKKCFLLDIAIVPKISKYVLKNPIFWGGIFWHLIDGMGTFEADGFTSLVKSINQLGFGELLTGRIKVVKCCQLSLINHTNSCELSTISICLLVAL